MGLFKSKDQIITAEVDQTKLITKSPVEDYLGGNVQFDIPEDYIGVFLYDRMNYVFYREDIIIPQSNKEAFFPKKAFIGGKKFKFYLINPDYKFDTIKTAILGQHYEKEKAKGVEFKCTFRVDLYIRLLKGNKTTLKNIVKKYADRIESLDEVIQEDVSPILNKVVSKYVSEELANSKYIYEEFNKSSHLERIQKNVIASLKEELAQFAVRPYELTLNIYTPEEGEKRLTQINDIMFEKVIDDLEHEMHDAVRKEHIEDRELDIKEKKSLDASTVISNKYKCPQCNNLVDKDFAFCPYCKKELK